MLAKTRLGMCVLECSKIKYKISHLKQSNNPKIENIDPTIVKNRKGEYIINILNIVFIDFKT